MCLWLCRRCWPNVACRTIADLLGKTLVITLNCMSHPVFTSKKDCASLLGVSVRTLERWSGESWFKPRLMRNRTGWNFEAIQKARPVGGNRPTLGESDGGDVTSLKSIQRLLKLEELRSKRAKADMDEAEACKLVGLLMPRLTSEMVLSLLFVDVQKFLAEVWDLTHQIPGLTEELSSSVSKWGLSESGGFLNGLQHKIERALTNLGAIPDLETLAAGASRLAAASEDSDGDVGGVAD